MRGPLKTLKLAYWPTPTDRPTETDEALPPEPKNNPNEAQAVAYGVAVGHVINRPDGIRARAQVSATISAAVAAALAAFAPLTGLSLHEWWPQVFVALAVVGWLVSLWRYILVIGYSIHDYADEIEVAVRKAGGDANERHLRRFLLYASHMRARVERGTAATVMALIWTLLALVALATEPLMAPPAKELSVSLNAKGIAAIDPMCEVAYITSPLYAEARPDDLNQELVPLAFDAKDCMQEAVVVHVRRGWIQAVRHPD